MQTNYGFTVEKLSKLQSPIPNNLNDNTTTKEMSTFQAKINNESARIKLSEYQKQMSKSIETEKDINERKRMFNRENGRKAVIPEVFILDCIEYN